MTIPIFESGEILRQLNDAQIRLEMHFVPLDYPKMWLKVKIRIIVYLHVA